MVEITISCCMAVTAAETLVKNLIHIMEKIQLRTHQSCGLSSDLQNTQGTVFETVFQRAHCMACNMTVHLVSVLRCLEIQVL